MFVIVKLDFLDAFADVRLRKRDAGREASERRNSVDAQKPFPGQKMESLIERQRGKKCTGAIEIKEGMILNRRYCPVSHQAVTTAWKTTEMKGTPRKLAAHYVPDETNPEQLPYGSRFLCLRPKIPE